MTSDWIALPKALLPSVGRFCGTDNPVILPPVSNATPTCRPTQTAFETSGIWRHPSEHRTTIRFLAAAGVMVMLMLPLKRANESGVMVMLLPLKRANESGVMVVLLPRTNEPMRVECGDSNWMTATVSTVVGSGVAYAFRMFPLRDIEIHQCDVEYTDNRLGSGIVFLAPVLRQ
ncbi:hypothetical protein T265_07222 [Opisthorchis viverrini]|uniref:Uncharacterized protein n=1 Tax=Opisthorchis viverrini TaxID=6198 RepID=A0A075AC56_OPIVI|nr:hypothetical protein T265_07222 [Opisthorchis viverrini]KER25279.1 hypothetical protein T265_07222 [Opisthorchis viverrini]